MHWVGLDIIEIHRIERALARWGERFLERIYTEREQEFYGRRAESLAALFASKEAVMKALGTGARMRNGAGVGWREIEVLPDPLGKPIVYLHGRAQKRAQELGMSALDISLSHSRDYAVASVVGGGE
ncbi:MAG: holo-ACP synthase [Dehalococcoidia bacterium]